MSASPATSCVSPLANPPRTYEAQLQQNVGWALEEGSLFFEQKGAVHDTLRHITQRLHELRLPYAVSGGLALAAHGYRRFTEHVDILVTKQDLRRIQKELSGRGFVPPFQGSKNLRDTETRVKVEFLIAGQYPGDGEPKPVSFPNPADVRIEIDGIYYLRLNSLVELKLASGITQVDRAKDLCDVQELIRVLGLPREFSEQLNPFVHARYQTLWDQVHVSRRRFVMLWRSRWNASNAKSLDDLLETLTDAVEQLQVMKADGVALDPAGETSDGHVRLVTGNPSVAAKYGMEDERELWDADATEGDEDEYEG
jgi:hypothetical protein